MAQLVNLRETEQAIRKGKNFPVIVEDVGLFCKLRITTLLKELPKGELSFTWMCLGGETAFSHNIKIPCRKTQGQAYVFIKALKFLKH